MYANIKCSDWNVLQLIDLCSDFISPILISNYMVYNCMNQSRFYYWIVLWIHLYSIMAFTALHLQVGTFFEQLQQQYKKRGNYMISHIQYDLEWQGYQFINYHLLLLRRHKIMLRNVYF
ncbi:unnamed protein product [Paramecium octaurelia]|uniref:Uncharacterized protein n=1 Tax=Paramecium octaurelia TaxID=43137 RepID=A0A8S1W6Z9_PAROT|nr:unnamed protein product [Paramecium octaurelia]